MESVRVEPQDLQLRIQELEEAVASVRDASLQLQMQETGQARSERADLDSRLHSLEWRCGVSCGEKGSSGTWPRSQCGNR